MEARVEKLFGDHVLEEAAKRFGLTAGVYSKLGDFENYVFEGVRSGEPAILRLTHSSHRTEAEVAAELSWIAYLVSEKVNIPACYPSGDGRLTEVIPTGDSYFTASLFQKAEGHHPDFKNPEEWNTDLFTRWGELTGRMHEATSRYKLEANAPKRPAWDTDDLLVNAANYIASGDEFVLERLDTLLRHMDKLPRAKEVYGLIHTDIHPRNFFIENGNIHVFDFDDSAYNWFIHDVAIPLYYSLTWTMADSNPDKTRDFTLQFVASFMNGYRSAYNLPPEWMEQVPYFLKLRDIILYLVIHKKIAPQEWTPRIQSWMANIKDRILKDVPIVDLDFANM